MTYEYSIKDFDDFKIEDLIEESNDQNDVFLDSLSIQIEEVLEDLELTLKLLSKLSKESNIVTEEFLHIADNEGQLTNLLKKRLKLHNESFNEETPIYDIANLVLCLEEEKENIFVRFINWLLATIKQSMAKFKSFVSRLNFYRLKLKGIKENIDDYGIYKGQNKSPLPMVRIDNKNTILNPEELLAKMQLVTSLSNRVTTYKQSFIDKLKTLKYFESREVLLKEMDELLSSHNFDKLKKLIEEINEVLPINILLKKENDEFKIEIQHDRNMRQSKKVFGSIYRLNIGNTKFKKRGFEFEAVKRLLDPWIVCTESMYKNLTVINTSLGHYESFVNKMEKTPNEDFEHINKKNIRALITLPKKIDDINSQLIIYFSKVTYYYVILWKYFLKKRHKQEPPEEQK